MPELDEYARRLSDTLDRAATFRDNEAELREDADPVIREAAAALYGLSDLDVTAERRPGGRPYDKAYGGLIVEWEWNMGGARKRHGAEQAIGYLDAMRREVGLDRAFSAVVCDGKQWGFLIDDRAPDEQPSLLEPQPEHDAERFAWVPNSEAACRRFLELLGTNDRAPLSSGALAGRFGRHSDVATRAVTLLLESLRTRDPNDRVDTLFREWRRLLEVVYGDLDDSTGELAAIIRDAYELSTQAPLGELLFCLHTYFGIVVRLSAVEILAISTNEPEARPTSWAGEGDLGLIELLEAVDEGRLPVTLRVTNLFEGDVFSWYLDVLPGNRALLQTVRDMIAGLGAFAFPRIAFGANPATDILRDLYQELVPRQLRRALGEFFTPHWLADAVLEELVVEAGVDVGSARVLDPTCGTGTFLVPLIAARARALRSEFGIDVPEESVHALTRSIVGFDINPVAVLAARVNYLTALGDLRLSHSS